jgi:hypothetical protein
MRARFENHGSHTQTRAERGIKAHSGCRIGPAGRSQSRAAWEIVRRGCDVSVLDLRYSGTEEVKVGRREGERLAGSHIGGATKSTLVLDFYVRLP